MVTVVPWRQATRAIDVIVIGLSKPLPPDPATQGDSPSAISSMSTQMVGNSGNMVRVGDYRPGQRCCDTVNFNA